MSNENYSYANMQTAMYMGLGAMEALQELDLRQRGPLLEAYSGQCGLMDELIPLAVIADELYEAAIGDEGAPGVWQYEIAEEFGGWWVKNGCPDGESSKAQLAAMIHAWVSPSLTKEAQQ